MKLSLSGLKAEKKNEHRCEICGGLTETTGCIASHVETRPTVHRPVPRVKHPDFTDPDPFEHLTPAERFARAIERRDAIIRARR